MDDSRHIIIVGGGHLALHIDRKLKAQGFSPIRIATTHDPSLGKDDRSIYDHHRALFEQANIDRASTVYIVDTEDRLNIEYFVIAAGLNRANHIVVALFNNNIAAHLCLGHPHVTTMNPGTLAAKVFVDAVKESAPPERVVVPQNIEQLAGSSPSRTRWPIAFISFFVLFILGASTFFHFTEKLSWLDSLYFSTTVITTTGFGDITLLHSAPFVKIFGIFLMFAAVTMIYITFSLVVEQLLNQRTAKMLGQKNYRLKDHVVLAGLGRIGYQIALELLSRKYKVLVIEFNPKNRYITSVRNNGGEVFVADATLVTTLQSANIRGATALISAIEGDVINLEIGLNARSLLPHIHLILRIFDKDIAEEMGQHLSIPGALNASEIAARSFVATM